MKRILSVALLALALPAYAAGLADQVGVVDPYVRMAPPGTKTTGAFMLLKNAGDKEAKLVAAASSAAGVTEFMYAPMGSDLHRELEAVRALF